MEGTPRTRSRTRQTAAILAVAALFAAFRPAFAQDAADDIARRMDDRTYFVRSLGRGWEPLLTDFQVTLKDLPESDRGPVLRVRDVAVETYADLRAADRTEGGEKRALELYDLLATDGFDAARRPEFARKGAQIELTWAGRAEQANQDSKALELALAAAKRSPGFDAAYDMIARLGIKESRKAEDRDDFFAALDILTRSTQLLPESVGARGKLDERRREILATTGEVSVQWLGEAARLSQVRGPKTDFTQAKIEFRPLGGQKAPPVQDAARPMRLRNGRYQVTARGNGPAPFEAGQIDVAAAGASVLLVTMLPQNMVIVAPSGGLDAFLIDRTEVTRTELANPGGGNTGGDRTAASGVNFQAAQNYSRSAGKDLPSAQQWLAAAFGDPAGKGRRYPWGDQAPQAGTHFIGGEAWEGPVSVDSCPAGASASGCLNMAGNVMEWLADGRFIGGSFKRKDFERDLETSDETVRWRADYLRHPIYDYAVWDALPPQERARYVNWRANQDGSTYAQVGLRCVVPLGKPRRNP